MNLPNKIQNILDYHHMSLEDAALLGAAGLMSLPGFGIGSLNILRLYVDIPGAKDILA